MQDQIIFKGKDRFTSVEVIDTPLERNLHFGTSIVQSSMSLSDPYAVTMEYNQVMLLALLFKPNPRKALFLGLGGGTKPKFVWRHFPQAICTSVEISPLVIETAKTYFALPNDTRFIIESASAEEYLSRPGPLQDLIFVDLYLADRMADAPNQSDFFRHCKAHLHEDGILVWNLWRSATRGATHKAIQQLDSLFEEVLLLQVEESPNLILIGKQKTALSRQNLEKQASYLTTLTGLDFISLLNRIKK